MSEYSENQLVYPAIIAIGKNGGKISTTDLISILTDVLKPSGKDLEILSGRSDTSFSQKVRNLKAHNTLGKLGYASATSDGWKITTEGEKIYKQISNMLKPSIFQATNSRESPLQQIFYGAPGTGKSYTIDQITTQDNSIRTTFHPDSDYSTFVGCYKPQKDGDKITYGFTAQAFTKAYVEAWKNTESPFYLVIEEINRGNCAQIFGDIFQLLDRGDDDCSKYTISPDDDLRKYLEMEFQNVDIVDAESAKIKSGKILKLPSNLHIWATMNTSDQSLFPIDSAFKRRWNWKYVPIKDGSLSLKAEGKKPFFIIKEEFVWWNFVEKINKRISSATNSEDKQLGYWFAKGDDTGKIDADTFVSKVVYYLWNDVFKDYGRSKHSPFVEGLKFHEFFDEKGDVIESKAIEFIESIMDLKAQDGIEA